MQYLDHNATSPLRPEARAAIERALALGGNASSVHGQGRKAHAALEEARTKVGALANADPQTVIFTSGGTEANALALHAAIHGAADIGARLTRIFVSSIEHQLRSCQRNDPGRTLRWAASGNATCHLRRDPRPRRDAPDVA